MSAFQQTAGIVTKVSSTPTQSVEYGPGFQFYIELDNGITVSVRGSKPHPNGKDPSGEWAPIYVGANISLFYTTNTSGGKTYNNSKAGSITVLSSGDASASPGATPAAGGAATASGGASAAPRGKGGINPEYAVGRWVNGAVALLAANHVKTLKEGVLELAKLEVGVTANFDAILASAKTALTGKAPPDPAVEAAKAKEAAERLAAEQARAAAEAAAASAPPNEPDFDDDIPF